MNPMSQVNKGKSKGKGKGVYGVENEWSNQGTQWGYAYSPYDQVVNLGGGMMGSVETDQEWSVVVRKSRSKADMRPEKMHQNVRELNYVGQCDQLHDCIHARDSSYSTWQIKGLNCVAKGLPICATDVVDLNFLYLSPFLRPLDWYNNRIVIAVRQAYLYLYRYFRPMNQNHAILSSNF